MAYNISREFLLLWRYMLPHQDHLGLFSTSGETKILVDYLRMSDKRGIFSVSYIIEINMSPLRIPHVQHYYQQ